MLYSALIVPHFDLGNTIYTVAAQYQLNRLQVIQNAAARLIILADAKTPTYELHERLKWDTLATRSSKAMVRITYSCLHTKSPAYLFDMLTPIEHEGRITRAAQTGVMTEPRTRSNLGKHSFGYRAPTTWNQTKAEIKAAVNMPQLKRLLKTSWYG